MNATTRLKQLIHRQGQVLSVMHPPTAALARIMERSGCEALFVGTSGVVGGYTGMADVGTATMTECVQVAGWIADSVTTPVIIDGDTGHGGIMAVRRLVRESIKAGIAGIRIDDQPIEGKRRTQSAGLEVVPLEQAIVRYRAAVDMKNELDPDFVIMAQCYARDAANGGLDDALRRLAAYHARRESIGCSSNRRIRSRRSGRRARRCRARCRSCAADCRAICRSTSISRSVSPSPGCQVSRIMSSGRRCPTSWRIFPSAASRRGKIFGPPQGPPVHHSRTAARWRRPRQAARARGALPVAAALEKYRSSAGGDLS